MVSSSRAAIVVLGRWVCCQVGGWQVGVGCGCRLTMNDGSCELVVVVVGGQ